MAIGQATLPFARLRSAHRRSLAKKSRVIDLPARLLVLPASWRRPYRQIGWGLSLGDFAMTTATADARGSTASTRWIQLVLGLIAMMSISSPQYVWTLFTGPLNQKLGTTLAELQFTFS